MKNSFLLSAVVAAVAISLPATAGAQTSNTVDEVIVRSNPSEKNINDIISVTNVFSEDHIQANIAQTIGELVRVIPGVHSASHGPAVGRPIIRGQGGFRVGTLENGIGINDVSATGNDHANAFGLFDIERVEVLKGPSALRYGAYGNTGVINSFNRHLDFNSEQLGQVSIGGGSVADQSHQAIFIRPKFETISFALSAFDADSKNIHVPTHSESNYQLLSEGEEVVDVSMDVENTQSDTQGASLSTQFQIGETNIAVLATQYDLNYGVPGHAHEEEEGVGEEGAEEAITIGMGRDTVRALVSRELDGPIEKLEAHLHISEFSQTEFEGSAAATQFEQDATDAKIELFNAPIYGWRGVIGAAIKETDLTAQGDEAYFPSADEATNSLYVIQSQDIGNWIGEFALRFDRVDLSSTDVSRDFDAFNISAGAGYRLNSKSLIGGSITSTERAPNLIELFADGVHAAAQRYERGNATLDIEKSIATEVYFRRSFQSGEAQLSFFRNDYSNFIFLKDAETSIDGAPVYDYLNSDAVVEGLEVSVKTSRRIKALDWITTISYSDVWGELGDGSDLRSLPPRKIGLQSEIRAKTLSFGLGVTYAFAQRDHPTGQFPTDSFTDVDANITWMLPALSGARIIASVDNLLDSEIRHHTSELKDLVPEAGRNFRLSASISF